MLIETITPHPDLPGIARQVVVNRVDSIDYVQKSASIFIRIDHLTPAGDIHPYLGSFSAFMTTSNEKRVDQLGNLLEADQPGGIGEFDWLYAAIESGTGLHALIRAMIQRNAKRGNFNTGNYRN